ncbi:hypothetical protein ACJX0J_011580, partial [Zea mays]
SASTDERGGFLLFSLFLVYPDHAFHYGIYAMIFMKKNIYNIHMRNSDAGQDDRAALKERFAFYYIKRSLEIGRLWMSNKKELESSAFDGGHEVIRVEQYELQIFIQWIFLTIRKKLDKGGIPTWSDLSIQIQYLFLHLSPTIMLHDVPMLGCGECGAINGLNGIECVNGQQVSNHIITIHYFSL